MGKPDWAPDQSKWPAGCTPSGDGWYRWYKGRTRFVASSKTPLREIEDKWIKIKRRIDGETLGPADMTYRAVLGKFIDACELRVARGKPRPMSPRTLANFDKILNDFGLFVGGGTMIDQIGPDHFARYARKYSHLKSSSYKDVISRVSTFFRWAEQMEYIGKFRPGPQFREPSKQELRDDRIARVRSFTAAEIAKLIDTGTGTMRLLIMLGASCAMNNSEVANLKRDVVDLKEKVIDFRRRKTGLVRRVCPIPDDVAQELEKYARPTPALPEYAKHFFLSANGTPYDDCPTTISRLMRKVMQSAGLVLGEGRNFAGLRTSFYNLCPPSGYEMERSIIMGHAHGTVALDNYLETVHLDRLRHVSNFVWNQISTLRADSRESPQPEHAAPPSDPEAPKAEP